MVEAVGDDGVPVAEQRLEHAAIGVETGREHDRVRLLEVLGDRLLEFAMQRLRAANEAHRRHAKAELVHGAAGRGDDIGVIGEAEVIVGAEIDRIVRALRRGDTDAAARGPVSSRSGSSGPAASMSSRVAPMWLRKASVMNRPFRSRKGVDLSSALSALLLRELDVDS